MRLIRIILVIAALGAATVRPAFSAPGNGVLYGTDGANLFAIDQNTGAGTLVGALLPGTPLGFASLATDPGGTMYAVGRYPATGEGGISSSLFVVNPASGGTTNVGDLGILGSDYAPGGLTGMDAQGGSLFAAQDLDFWQGADRLVIIDPDAVTVSEAAPFGRTFGSCISGPVDPERQQCSIEGMDALAFDAEGTLYGAIAHQHVWWPDWPNGAPVAAGAPGLYRVDPVSGAASCDTWPFPQCFFYRPITDASGAPPAGGVTSLQFACNGTLYGGTGDGRLVTIDPLSGRFTYVGVGSVTAGSPLLDLAFGSGSCAPADSTPPVIQTPASVTVDADGPDGAVVSFSVTASDPDDAVASLSCAPRSGSSFPIGSTTVTCTATDTHGNSASASFTVHVEGAAQQLADLRTALAGVGPGSSLVDKVARIQALLAAKHVSDACRTLGALIHELSAQSGKTIPVPQAATLIASTVRIATVLGC